MAHAEDGAQVGLGSSELMELVGRVPGAAPSSGDGHSAECRDWGFHKRDYFCIAGGRNTSDEVSTNHLNPQTLLYPSPGLSTPNLTDPTQQLHAAGRRPRATAGL